MRALQKGIYFGRHRHELQFDDLHLTDTEYTHGCVDWHYHSNPYFTYLIAGKLFEANRKEEYFLAPGSLLYHHWQDAHYNRKPEVYTQGFHLEIAPAWFERLAIPADKTEGSLKINDPLIRETFDKIYLESKIQDPVSRTSIDLLLVRLFDQLQQSGRRRSAERPKWVDSLEELIREDSSGSVQLNHLAGELDMHPVHLSRDFSRYFSCSFGEYVRKLRVQQAGNMLKDQARTMAEITYDCGFADQSHFIRTFKRYYQLTPRQYRRKICSR